MNNYSQHFKKMKSKKKKMSLSYRSNKVKPTGLFANGLGLLCLIGFSLSLYGFLYPEKIIEISHLKLGFFSKSLAADKEKSAEPKVKEEENIAATPKKDSATESVKENAKVKENVSHIEELLVKEKELVEREKKIHELEEKLQQTQSMLDEKMKLLDQARREIASKLETRVTQDQESIDKLVGVYSNMKPQSAAQVISRLDEELAISVLKRMKKQDAGSILNYMDTQKAKSLSEKYSGY